MLKRVAALAVVLGLFAMPVRAETLDVGQLKVSFYAVTRAVVVEVLERLGHDAVVRIDSHAPTYAALGAGEIDFLVNAWLPHAHGRFWEQHGDRAIRLATLYEGAQLIWAVPDYVPEDAVSSIADLGKADVRERMTPVIQGVGADAGIMARSRRVMEAYGLDRAGYELRTGSNEDRERAVADAVAAERWVVVPLGRPMYLNPVYDLRPLDDPQGVLGDANEGVLLGHESLPGKIPASDLAVLRRIAIGRAAVEAMDVMVNVDGTTPEAAAKAWLADNPEALSRWLDGP